MSNIDTILNSLNINKETKEQIKQIVEVELKYFDEKHDEVEKVIEVLHRKGLHSEAMNLEKIKILQDSRKQTVEEYLQEETWEVHENANINFSLQGLNSFISGKIIKEYWLTKIYPENIAKLARDGFVHIHNLNMLSTYCVGWDLEDLIRRGFGGVPGKPYSKPAKHLSSILGQMVNFLFVLQNEAAGAVAFSSFDTYLAPFVYFDKLTYKEVKQQIQEFVYNMNQTMRTGGQS
ncbi:MAG: anaerobic ribonucleoside-triphosphate reductase, partial [archaeon]